MPFVGLAPACFQLGLVRSCLLADCLLPEEILPAFSHCSSVSGEAGKADGPSLCFLDVRFKQAGIIPTVIAVLKKLG